MRLHAVKSPENFLVASQTRSDPYTVEVWLPPLPVKAGIIEFGWKKEP